jgi:hypothetical protein
MGTSKGRKPGTFLEQLFHKDLGGQQRQFARHLIQPFVSFGRDGVADVDQLVAPCKTRDSHSIQYDHTVHLINVAVDRSVQDEGDDQRLGL